MLKTLAALCLVPALVSAAPNAALHSIRARLRGAARAADRQAMNAQLTSLRESLSGDHRPAVDAVVLEIPRIVADPTSSARDRLLALINQIEDSM